MSPERLMTNWRIDNKNYLSSRIILLVAILVFFILVGYNMVFSQAPDFATAQVPTTSLFGVELYPVNNSGGLVEIQATQTRFTRGAQVIWKDIEAVQGVYDWTKLDPTVLAIQNLQTVSGAEPIVVVRGTPFWAQKYKIPSYSCGPIEVEDFVNFGNFMQQVITELRNRNIVIKYWEIWNEPDIPRQYVSNPDNFWGGCWGELGTLYYGGDYYGEMLKVVYPKIKAADPNAVVLVGGLLLDCDPSNPPVDPNRPPNLKDCSSGKFLEGIILAGAVNAFDGVAFHAFDFYDEILLAPIGTIGVYQNANWPSSGWDKEGPALVSKVQFIKSILNKYGVTNKLLISTENALLDCPFCTNTNPYPPLLEDTKASYVAQVYAASIAEGLTANIWFDATGSWLRNNGLVKVSNPSEKLPAYDAYKFAASFLEGAQLDHQVVEFDGITGYKFYIGSNRQIWLLWSHDGLPHAVPTLTPPNSLQLIARDVFGDVIANPVSITLQPTYFETPRLVYLPIIDNNYRPPIFLGSFETGMDGWTLINSGLPASRITAHPIDPRTSTQDLDIPSGIASILLGNPSFASCPGVPLGYAAIEKLISVPGITNVPIYLSFDYIIYTEDASSRLTYDRFEVYLSNDPTPSFFDGYRPGMSGACYQWKRIPSTQVPSINGQTSGWAKGFIDVSSYQGQTIMVSFRNYNRNDGYYNTYTFVDNIQLLFGP